MKLTLSQINTFQDMTTLQEQQLTAKQKNGYIHET